MAYRTLTKEEQERFDPMITGFNPADMYAADHIRRVLQTFPARSQASENSRFIRNSYRAKLRGNRYLLNPALDRNLDFAGTVGLVVLIHNDMDMPFAKEGSQPLYLNQMKAVLKRHPNTTIIWAHTAWVGGSAEYKITRLN